MAALKPLVLALALLALPQGIRMGWRVVAGGGGSLFTLSDLSCDKVFLSPQYNTGGASFLAPGGPVPTTFRYNGDTREWFLVEGGGHVYSFLEPAGSSCATAIGSVSAASWPGWGGDWGSITPLHNVGEVVPNVDNFSFVSGLSYDNVADEFVIHWYSAYNDPHNKNNLKRITLFEGDHSMTSLGCHAVSGVKNVLSNTGIVMIPQSFIDAHLSAGQYWGIGLGGLFAPQSSSGPALFAATKPSNNACAANTDYLYGSPTTLMSYVNVNGGPTCDQLLVDGGPLCGDTTPITRPHAARTSLTGYSSSMYTWTWEPSDGTGWMGWDTNIRLAWYDDRTSGGSKYGIFAPFMTPSGAINTTVLASPAPTSTSMRLASTLMNDGSHINPGDTLWVESCGPTLEVPIGDAPDDCDTAENGRNFSIIVVSTVNTSTGDITFTTPYTDASGDGVPDVGGGVWGGSVYMWGTPSNSRRTVRAQMYNPDRLAEVADGDRDADQVVYTEEEDWCSIIHHLGCPSAGGGIPSAISSYGPSAGNAQIAAALPDHAAKQIIVAVSKAVEGGGVAQTLYYVFDVNSPAPMPLAMLPIAGLCVLLLGPAGWLYRGRTRRQR